MSTPPRQPAADPAPGPPDVTADGMPRARIRVRPRYGEVDSMGVVYHANYLAYFDMGRTEVMRQRGLPYAELEHRGFQLVVMEVGVRYRRPARYDEELELVSWVARVRHATVLFEYELFGPDGELLVTGFTKLGCLGSDGKPSPLPDEALEILGGRPARGGSGSPAAPPSSEEP